MFKTDIQLYIIISIKIVDSIPYHLKSFTNKNILLNNNIKLFFFKINLYFFSKTFFALF